MQSPDISGNGNGCVFRFKKYIYIIEEVPKFSDAKNFAVIYLGPYIEAKPSEFCQNGENRIAINEDPDLAAPQGAL